MAVVTTGQITIVDNNDARPLTAFISASPGALQTFSKDETSIAYLPDWETANTNVGLILTARVYAGGTGGASDVTGQLTNRKWSTDLSTAITGTAALVSSNASLSALFNSGAGKTFTAVNNTTTSTLTIKSNIINTLAQATIYFEGDYTDPVTGLVSHVVASIVLHKVNTGTNAVYLLIEGNQTIEQGTNATKGVGSAVARLIRAGGVVDASGITYRWYENNGGTAIYNTAPFTTEYGMKTTAVATGPSVAPSTIGQNLPTLATDWSTYNTLAIHETAVADMGVYRVEAQDADGNIYQAYFTVYDIADPYDLKVISSSGDILQNGVGNTNLTPQVRYGSTLLGLSGWTFTWTFYNKDGKRGAFTDPTRTAIPGGITINSHTTGASTVFTLATNAPTVVAGDIIKCVTAAGAEYFYEVLSGTGASKTITMRAATTHASWLNTTNFPNPTANLFNAGKLYICQGAGAALGQVTTAAAAALAVSGDDIDAKGTIFCDGNRP
jgi:hypothetical protein